MAMDWQGDSFNVRTCDLVENLQTTISAGSKGHMDESALLIQIDNES